MSGNQFSFKECNLISYGQLGSHTSLSALFFNLLLSITQKRQFANRCPFTTFPEMEHHLRGSHTQLLLQNPWLLSSKCNLLVFAFFFFPLSLSKNKVLYALHLSP